MAEQNVTSQNNGDNVAHQITAYELIRQAECSRNEEPLLPLFDLVEALPKTLESILNSLLESYDYQQNTNSSPAVCFRMLAAMIHAIKSSPEFPVIKNESKILHNLSSLEKDVITSLRKLTIRDRRGVKNTCDALLVLSDFEKSLLAQHKN
ncbi:hypothetical protein [uncultured Desulfuromonas sp.]|uniref:hypothetical protein n=1 Tax=uncultured Desulfuromonas sp. TaxID=181013 RepID=UPI002AAB54E8|nr:hypothetical protein [uncultured Desulfuromonas sp.]